MSSPATLKFRPGPPTLRLDILTAQDEGFWVAHCVQLDLVATGASESEAFTRATEICVEQISHAMKTDNLGNLFRPPNAQLLQQMFSARSEGYIHVEMERRPAQKTFLDLEFQRLIAA